MTTAISIPLVLVLLELESRPAIDDLFYAIRMVETGGNNAAIGDGGRAIGPYQIQYTYWKDSGVPGRYEQCREPRYAERVMQAYWQRYCPTALAAGDRMTLARVHNGGPRGASKSKTIGYWRKVDSVMRLKLRGQAP